MKARLISLISANKIDEETGKGIEVIVNTEHICHFYKTHQKGVHSTILNLVSGQTILVTQSIEEIKQMISLEVINS